MSNKDEEQSPLFPTVAIADPPDSTDSNRKPPENFKGDATAIPPEEPRRYDSAKMLEAHPDLKELQKQLKSIQILLLCKKDSNKIPESIGNLYNRISDPNVALDKFLTLATSIKQTKEKFKPKDLQKAEKIVDQFNDILDINALTALYENSTMIRHTGLHKTDIINIDTALKSILPPEDPGVEPIRELLLAVGDKFKESKESFLSQAILLPILKFTLQIRSLIGNIDKVGMTELIQKNGLLTPSQKNALLFDLQLVTAPKKFAKPESKNYSVPPESKQEAKSPIANNNPPKKKQPESKLAKIEKELEIIKAPPSKSTVSSVEEFFANTQSPETKAVIPVEKALAGETRKLLRLISEAEQETLQKLSPEEKNIIFVREILQHNLLFSTKEEREQVYRDLRKILFHETSTDAQPVESTDFNHFDNTQDRLEEHFVEKQQSIRHKQLHYLLIAAKQTHFEKVHDIEALLKQDIIEAEQISPLDQAIREKIQEQSKEDPELENDINIAFRNTFLDKLANSNTPAEIITELKNKDLSELSLSVTSEGYFELDFSGIDSRLLIAKLTQARNAKNELVSENVGTDYQAEILPSAATNFDVILLNTKGKDTDAIYRQNILREHEIMHCKQNEILQIDLNRLETRITNTLFRKILTKNHLENIDIKLFRKQFHNIKLVQRNLVAYLRDPLANNIPNELLKYTSDIKALSTDTKIQTYLGYYENRKETILQHSQILDETATKLHTWDRKSNFTLEDAGLNFYYENDIRMKMALEKLNIKDFDPTNPDPKHLKALQEYRINLFNPKDPAHIAILSLIRFINDNKAKFDDETQIMLSDMVNGKDMPFLNLNTISQLIESFKLSNHTINFENIKQLTLKQIETLMQLGLNQDFPLEQETVLCNLFSPDSQGAVELPDIATERMSADKHLLSVQNGNKLDNTTKPWVYSASSVRQMAYAVPELSGKNIKPHWNPWKVNPNFPQMRKSVFFGLIPVPGTGFAGAQSWLQAFPGIAKWAESPLTEEQNFFGKGLLPFAWGKNRKIVDKFIKYVPGLQTFTEKHNIKPYKNHPYLDQYLSLERKNIEEHIATALKGVMSLQQYGLSTNQLFQILAEIGGFTPDYYRGTPEQSFSSWKTDNDELRNNPALYEFLIKSEGMDPDQISFLKDGDSLTPLGADDHSLEATFDLKGTNVKIKKGTMTDSLLSIMGELTSMFAEEEQTKLPPGKGTEHDFYRFKGEVDRIGHAMMREDKKLIDKGKDSRGKRYTIADLIIEIKNTDRIGFLDEDLWESPEYQNLTDDEKEKAGRTRFKEGTSKKEIAADFNKNERANPRKYIWIGEKDPDDLDKNRFLVEDARRFVAQFYLAKSYRTLELGLYGNIGSIDIKKTAAGETTFNLNHQLFKTANDYLEQGYPSITTDPKFAELTAVGPIIIFANGAISKEDLIKIYKETSPWLNDLEISEIISNQIPAGEDGEIKDFKIFHKDARRYGKNVTMGGFEIPIDSIERFSPELLNRLWGEIKNHEQEDGSNIRHIDKYGAGGIIYQYYDWYDEIMQSARMWTTFQLRSREVDMLREQSDLFQDAWGSTIKLDRAARLSTLLASMFVANPVVSGAMILGTIGWSLFISDRWKQNEANWKAKLKETEIMLKNFFQESETWGQFGDKQFNTTVLKYMFGETKRIRAMWKGLYNKNANPVKTGYMNKALSSFFGSIGTVAA
ncbi:MAG: hypothetical protein WCJ58_02180 [bacterium]